MKNIEKKLIYLKKLKQLILSLYQKNTSELDSLCTMKTSWKLNNKRFEHSSLRKIYDEIISSKEYILDKLIFKDIYVMALDKDEKMVQISGYYTAVYDNALINNEVCNDILITFAYDKTMYVQINTRNEEKKIYKIKSANEEVYFLEEKDIYYIESNHNQVIWHCVNYDFSANDSLKHLEIILSDNFVRIQRGYLVNRKSVKCIRRCEIELINGDVLSVPCKKYVEVRKKILDINE